MTDTAERIPAERKTGKPLPEGFRLWFIRIASFVFGLCALISWSVFCIQNVVFDHSFYMDLYERIHLAERENLDPEDLEKALFAMTDYVEGKRDDLEEEIVWKGRRQPAFNEKETAHMVDVKALWQNAHAVMIGCLISLPFLGAAVFLASGKNAPGYLCRGMVQAITCFLVILLFFGFWVLVDFTGFWTEFHHIFFTNDLWLLDPSVDFMIVICPEEMFSSMIAKILLPAALGIAAAGLGSWLYLKRKARIGI